MLVLSLKTPRTLLTAYFQAHDHARKASTETQKANSAFASDEHELAAGEFANAAKETGDVEVMLAVQVRGCEDS